MDVHGNFSSYTQSFPPAVQRYVAVNLDTIPKVTNHILVFLAISDFFLLINSMRVAFATFLAASVLTLLTCFVTMVTNNNRISFAPRGLEPTEFMIGLSLGLCVAGAILSFFSLRDISTRVGVPVPAALGGGSGGGVQCRAVQIYF